MVEYFYIDGADTYIYINPPKDATHNLEILEDNDQRTIERHEWSHGLIAIVENDHISQEVTPTFNYGVLHLENGDYEIDYSSKNRRFKDKK